MAASPRSNDGVDGARMHVSRGMRDPLTASPGTPRRCFIPSLQRSAPPALSSSAWSAAHVDAFLQPLQPIQPQCQCQFDCIIWPTPASCRRIRPASACSNRAWFVSIGAGGCRCDGRPISSVARRMSWSMLMRDSNAASWSIGGSLMVIRWSFARLLLRSARSSRVRKNGIFKAR